MMTELLPWVKDLGVPAFIAAFLIFVAYKLGAQFIDKIVVPLKDAHIAFVNSLKVQLEELTKSQGNLVNTLNTVSKTIQAMEDRLEHLER